MNAKKLAALLLLSVACATTQAAAPVLDATLGSFAVLGGSAVTNTGNTVLTGNLGGSNNSSPTGITGFFGTILNDGPGIVNGNIHQGDVFALAAETQLAGSITTLSLLGPGTVLGPDLAGQVLAPGIYTVPAAA